MPGVTISRTRDRRPRVMGITLSSSFICCVSVSYANRADARTSRPAAHLCWPAKRRLRMRRAPRPRSCRLCTRPPDPVIARFARTGKQPPHFSPRRPVCGRNRSEGRTFRLISTARQSECVVTADDALLSGTRDSSYTLAFQGASSSGGINGNNSSVEGADSLRAHLNPSR